MNYEQKYNEVLQKAKEEYNRLGELGNESMKRSFEIIFPELRESEDERILEWIIGIVNSCKELSFEDKVKLTKYLEKMKVRGPLTKEEEYTLQRIIEYLEDEGCPQSWKDLLYDIYNLPYEKQKEPTKEELYAEVGATEKEYVANTMKKVRAMREKHKEQKSTEWTLPEDFEEAVYKVTNFISPFDNQEELRKTSHRFAEQLMSLAKKELAEKPAEWSEEDEWNLVLVIECIDEFFPDPAMKYKLKDWLKSLRPQPHWKPSEEQMKAPKGVPPIEAIQK